MKLRITSFRGDHNCEVDEAVSKAVFDKLTGKTEEPLPAALKPKIPDTFQELQELWKPGKLNYLAADETNDLVTTFRPDIKELLFIAPRIGG